MREEVGERKKTERIRERKKFRRRRNTIFCCWNIKSSSGQFISSFLFHRRRYSALRVFTIASKILRIDCMDIDDDDRSRNCTNARSYWITLPSFQSFDLPLFICHKRTYIYIYLTYHVSSSYILEYDNLLLYKKKKQRNTLVKKYKQWLLYKIRMLTQLVSPIIIHIQWVVAGKKNDCKIEKKRKKTLVESFISYKINSIFFK
jgi:hypothetical protein